uniref:Uncharacterized protein n=1 Tax=Heterorhabditis bacteriophora TaxID=37862 RepID=A0A1I7WTI1_HETBA
MKFKISEHEYYHLKLMHVVFVYFPLIYDAGTIQLAGVFPGEERDCLN